MANNPYVNKVQLADGTTLIDISDTTAIASDVAQGKYFYTLAGQKVQGTATGGGGSVATAVQFNDYVVPSSKWASQNSIPNVIANGGCFHLIYTLQANASTTNDLQIAGFGIGGISSWSPNASTPCCYLLASKQLSNLRMHFRGGGGNTVIEISDYADANDRLNLKFYQDHYVDVNTSTSYNYDSSTQTWWNTLATKTYLSIGINQSNTFTGAVVEYWAFEEA